MVKKEMDRTLQSIADISALVIISFTLPNHFAYATKVSGWFDMYMRRNEDFSATGSDIVSTGEQAGGLSSQLCQYFIARTRHVESDKWRAVVTLTWVRIVMSYDRPGQRSRACMHQPTAIPESPDKILLC
jgi:hypothetical protein